MLSPSQISSWIDCRRKWFFQSALKLPQPEKESTAAGKRVHKILEDYLVDGTEIDRKERMGRDFNVGACATALARDLPPAASVPKSQVESHFVIGIDGIKIQGYRDLIDFGYVRDHKTTSALKWAKTPSDLQTDPQALIYAISMFAADYAGESVKCEWGYGQIKGPAKTLLVHTDFTETQAFDKYYEHVHPHALEILKARQLPLEESAAQELAPNLDACESFGGCPFQSQCRRPMRTLNGKKRLPMVMSREEALAMLKNRRRGVNPPPVEVSIPQDIPVAETGTFDQVVARGEELIKQAESAIAQVVAGTPAPVETPWDNTPSTNAQEVVDAETPAPEPKRRGRPARKEAPSSDSGFTLYIGCQPIKASCTYLHDIIPAIAEEVEKVNVVPHWSLMEFGAGRGALAGAMKEYLKQNTLTGAVVVKFPHLPETQAVMGVLVNVAKDVVVS